MLLFLQELLINQHKKRITDFKKVFNLLNLQKSQSTYYEAPLYFINFYILL